MVEDAWTPARIGPAGPPLPLAGTARTAAVEQWRAGRQCTGLGEESGQEQAADPAYESSGQQIDANLAARMRTSYGPGCPVPLSSLRYLTMSYRDFDGRSRTGEMVVHRRWTREVRNAFGALYDVGWPIARMRLVDDYGGDDNRSMAADNTSGFNCRRVAGQVNWSAHAHAYGEAIDLNPLQNPYVRPGSVMPPAGRRFAGIDRGSSADVPLGVIRVEDRPVKAFARFGWQWGGYWAASKDWQHLATPALRR